MMHWREPKPVRWRVKGPFTNESSSRGCHSDNQTGSFNGVDLCMHPRFVSLAIVSPKKTLSRHIGFNVSDTLSVKMIYMLFVRIIWVAVVAVMTTCALEILVLHVGELSSVAFPEV
jgi:hypothetical protein